MRAARGIILAVFLWPGIALADPCPGTPPFTDVAGSASYCTNTEWLRNRSITLGCTATAFCPDQLVTRAAMALFMNRLGIALTPQVAVASVNGGAMDLDTDTFVCVSSIYAAADYPRRMHLVASFSAHTNAAAAYDMNVRYNTDGSGEVFNSPANVNFQFGGSPGAGWSSVSSSAAVDLAAGVQYRFAIRIGRALMSGGSGEVNDYRCHLSQTLHNRNAVAAPLDVVGGDAASMDGRQ